MLMQIKASLLKGVGLASLTLFASPARALTSLDDFSHVTLFSSIITLGAMGVAGFLAYNLAKERKKRLDFENNEGASLKEAQSRLANFESLLLSEKQIRLIWEGSSGKPRIFGDIKSLFPQLTNRDFFNFDLWIAQKDIYTFRNQINDFLQRGEAFSLELETPNGDYVLAEGQAAGANAMISLKPLSLYQKEIKDKERLLGENRTALIEMEHFLDTLPHPIWLRDKIGKLRFVNRAFATAVEQPQTADAVLSNMNFLDNAVVEEIQRHRVANQAFTGAVKATAAGARRTFDVIDRPFNWGSAGLAVDVTDVDKLKRERAGEMASFRRTFDMVGIAVAIFDSDKRLSFYNRPFMELFGLKASFLDSNPSEGDLLDLLSELRKLPQESNYRLWKERFMAVYKERGEETIEDQWYLPDGSSLRVVRIPQAQGGVTTLFEDLTDKMKLEAQYSTLNRVQSETLEHLNEAVAVFGADGKLSLWNEAYATIWEISRELLKNRPHIDRINEWCQRALSDGSALTQIRNMIVTIGDTRAPFSGKVTLLKDETFEALAVPLPDGGTLITFRDITRDVETEKLRQEHNEKLMETDRLKTAFVEHVSYQLRTPLTTVVGYTEVLQAFQTGMSEQQREYLENISQASSELAKVITSILDFSQLESGAVTLQERQEIIRPHLEDVFQRIHLKRQMDGVKLKINIAPDVETLRCDPERFKQILYNILENAMNFAKNNGEVRFSAQKLGDMIHFTIEDDGAGMDTAVLSQVLKPFVASNQNTRLAPGVARGVGLGLTIAKMLIDLHKGQLTITTKKDQGTTVTVRLKA